MTVSDREPRPTDAEEELVLRLPEGDIHVRRSGPRTAPALLLIHGSAASEGSWDRLVPLLTGHHVIRIDLLGCGGSAKPADGDYSIPAQARRAAAALELLGVEHAIVAGHSSGGSAATSLAEQRPDLVTALVLINTGPSLDAFVAERMPFDPAQWSSLTDEQIKAAMASAFSPGYQPPQQFVAYVRAMPLHSFAAIMREGTVYLEQRSIPDRLAALAKPVLVIFGADDRRWRSDIAVPVYRAVAGVEVEVLDGLGHTPIVEDPQRTAAPLLAFAGAHAV